MNTKLIALLAITGGALAARPVSGAVFVGALDGASNSSVFEVGSATPLPSQGWIDIAGAGQIFDIGAGNGALIQGTDGFQNYTVQFDTGVTLQPNTTYTLSADLGFVAGTSGGQASYTFQIGLVDEGNFIGLGTADSGTVVYQGNLFSGVVSAIAQQTYFSGAGGQPGTIAVRFAQTANGGPSDYFGMDNVTMTAVPEPHEYALAGAVGLLGFAIYRRNKMRAATGPAASAEGAVL